MICSGCGAHLIDGTEKCPFCKEILSESVSSSSDVTYKIDSSKQFELIKNSSKAGISLQKRRENRKKKRRQRMLGYAILLALALVLIGIITGIISLLVHIFSDNAEYTTAFYSDNEIGVYYDRENVILTKEAVSLSSVAENQNISVDSYGLIQKSANGKVTVFIDKYDVKKNQGTLKVMMKDNAEDIITVSDKVSTGFILSDNGEHILFIKNANAKGNMGELWYSKKGDAPVKIADKVDSDKVVISMDNERALYIKNYNYKSRYGDAYFADFDDFSETKIDSEVYSLYGTAREGGTVVYSKDFNDDTESCDIYVHDGKKATRVVMSCGIAPEISENGKYVFVCGDKNEDRYNLYRVNLDDVTTEKIIANMSKINRISGDGKRVLYSKLFDNNVADYYIWTQGETELKVADGVNYTKENQVAVSENFERIAYIANYNEDKKGGLLYYCEYDEDSVSIAEKISDDVYSCYVLNNKKFVYTKNYSSKTKTAQLYVYDGIEKEINPEINPRYLKVENNEIISIYDYSSESGGNLYKIDADMNETKLTTDVYGFAIKDNGEISVMRNLNGSNGEFDLYETYGEEVALVKKGVEEILFY